MADFDWGALLNGLVSAGGAYMGQNTSGNAAGSAIQNSQFNPYNTAFSGLGGTVFNKGNSTISGGLSPEYQQLQQQLFGQAGQNMPNAGTLGAAGDYANANGPQLPGLAQGIYDQGQGFLNGLGGNIPQVQSQTPNDIYGTFQNRLGLLRQQAAPQEQRYLQNNFEGQFGKGILASSAGGYQTEGALNAINSADLQRQQTAYGMAGDDYTRSLQANAQNMQAQGANQNAFLTNQGLQGTLGSNLTGLGLQGALQQFQLGQGATNDRFGRALSMFGAQNQGLGQALGGLSGIGNIPIQLAQLGANVGSQQSQGNQMGSAIMNQQGQQKGDLIGSITNGLSTALGLGGALKQFFSGGSNYTPGQGWQNGVSAPTFEDPGVDMSLLPQGFNVNGPTGGYFNGAGGQAASPIGSSGGISGIQNPKFENPGVNLGLLPNYSQGFQGAGATGSWGSQGPDLGSILGKVGQVGGIYGGIKSGTPEGYVGAAANAASLAGYNVPGGQYIGAVSQLAKGDVPGAGLSAGIAATGPVGAAAAIVTQLINKSLIGHGDENRNFAAWMGTSGAKLVSQPVGRTAVGGYALNGKLLDGNYAKALAGAYYGAAAAPDGDQAGWQQKYDDLVAHPVEVKLPVGYTFDGTKIIKGFSH